MDLGERVGLERIVRSDLFSIPDGSDAARIIASAPTPVALGLATGHFLLSPPERDWILPHFGSPLLAVRQI